MFNFHRFLLGGKELILLPSLELPQLGLAYLSILMIHVQPHFQPDLFVNAQMYSHFMPETKTTAAIYPPRMRSKSIEQGSEQGTFMLYFHFFKGKPKRTPLIYGIFISLVEPNQERRASSWTWAA